MALMDLLQLRGYPRSKVGRIFNFHAVLRLHSFEPLLILRLLEGLDNLHDGIVEGPLVDLLGANQIKTIGLPDRSTDFSLLQSEDRGFDRFRIRAVQLDYPKIAILGGGSLIVGKVACQLAKISA